MKTFTIGLLEAWADFCRGEIPAKAHVLSTAAFAKAKEGTARIIKK